MAICLSGTETIAYADIKTMDLCSSVDIDEKSIYEERSGNFKEDFLKRNIIYNLGYENYIARAEFKR